MDNPQNSEFARNQRLQSFLQNLRRCRGVMSRNTLLTLRGQAISGDIEGAERGLARLHARANRS